MSPLVKNLSLQSEAESSEGEDKFTGLNVSPIREGDFIHTKLVNYKKTVHTRATCD